MLSMTGFGTAKTQLTGGELITQVKSVNSRFLDIKINIPREYSLFEKELRDLLKKKLSRGNVEIYCAKKNDPKKSKVNIQTDLPLAKNWLKSYSKLAKDLKVKSEPVSLLDIVKSVPVINVKEDKTIASSEKKIFLTTVNKAIDACIKERKREGMALKKSLKVHLSSLNKEISIIKLNRKKANQEIEKKWKAKLLKLKSNESMDPQRMAQEVSILLDKSDINEEVVRLAEHIKMFTQVLSKPGRVGKKLDFYSQELLREVNTIGSKSQVVLITQSVVNAKAIIEQIREQVQNIE